MTSPRRNTVLRISDDCIHCGDDASYPKGKKRRTRTVNSEFPPIHEDKDTFRRTHSAAYHRKVPFIHSARQFDPRTVPKLSEKPKESLREVH